MNWISHPEKIFAHTIHLSIFIQFPWLNEFLGQNKYTGSKIDLKYSNNLIHFLVISSPLTLFDINLRLIAAITCIISIRLRYTFP